MIDATSVSLYSVPIKDAPVKEGEGVPRRHFLIANATTGLVHADDPNITTLYENLKTQVSKYGSKGFLGIRAKNSNGIYGEYEWQTYSEVFERVCNFASGLASFGHKPQDKIGIYIKNTPEWVITENACYRMSYITVPIYETLGDEGILHIFNQTEIETVVCSKQTLNVLLNMRTSLTHVKRAICIDEMDENTMNKASTHHLQVHSFRNVEKEGEYHPAEALPPKASDLYTICYTSGTSALPKGVMLTHSSIVAAYSGVKFLVKHRQAIGFSQATRYLSYLPLAHIFERLVIQFMISYGAYIGFYHGVIEELSSDMKALCPTFFASVPRLYNKIYDKVMEKVQNSGWCTRLLFNWAYNVKLKNLKKGKLSHWIWDRIVFKKIRQNLGGCLEGMMSGSAPINEDVMKFLRVAFGCPVFEGYSQTETGGSGTVTSQYDFDFGHVGPCMPSNDFKLIDVPEMNYYSTNKPFPQGEILVRGPSNFIGYYKDEEKTKETMDDEGWIRTGDIGAWDEKGRLRLIDRKKNIFKLAQGEYIAPEKIENALSNLLPIKQMFVHGESLQSFSVAIVVPEEKDFIHWAQSKDFVISKVDSSLNANMALKKAFIDEINSCAKTKTTLKGFEIPKRVFFETEPFSIENNLMTTTFKIRRPQAILKYQKAIRSMYLE